MRRRGAGLSRDLVKLLPKDKREKLVRALLAIPQRQRRTGWNGSAQRAAPKIETQALANDVAVRLLAATKDNPAPGFCELGMQGLAYLPAQPAKRLANR